MRWEATAIGVCLTMILTATLVGPGPVWSSAPSAAPNPSLRPMATTVTVPPGMALSAACWSPYDKEYVVFGGYNSSSSSPTGSQPFYRNWSYTYQAGNWTNITLNSGFKMPNGGPSDTCFYYPPSHSIIFLIQPFKTVAGLSQTQSNILYTYSFEGGNWSNISATAGAAPPPEGDCWGGLPEIGTSTWDPVEGYGFYYVACPSPKGVTSLVPQDWAFSGGVWSDITSSVKGQNPKEIPVLTWDNQTQQIVLVGGWNTSADTKALKDYWTYANQTWTKENFTNMPDAGFSFSPFVAFDPTDNSLIVAGGIGGDSTQEGAGSNNYENVYELNGTVWTNITASSGAPSSRAWTSSGTSNNTADLMFGQCPQALTNCEPYYSLGKGQAQFFSGGTWSTTPSGHCAGNDCTGLPPAPKGLSIPTENYTSVTLRWANPGYWLENYTAYYGPGANCSGSMSALGTQGSGTTLTVGGLAPRTQYAFEVTAWNGTGQSVPSECLVRTTGLVPSAPTNLTVTETTLTSVTLNWTNPSGGGLVNDTVYWANGTECNDTLSADSLGMVGNSYQVSGLTVGTTYAFTVTAWNMTWQSPPSACINQTTAQVPGAPTDLHLTAFTKTSISLAWTNPTGGGLVNNTIYYGAGNSCSVATTALGTSGAVTSAKISGLKTGTEYAMEVTAWNVTQSPASACVVQTTAQVPSAPTGLTVGAFTTDSIEVLWTASGAGLRNLTVYEATGDACTGPMRPTSVTPGAGSSYLYNATGLTTGVEYAFDVTSWNATGQSPPSNCVVQTTAEVPAAPTHLAVSSVTGTSISVSWTNPGGGGLVSNTLYYAVGTSCSGTLTANPTATVQQAATLTKLDPGVEYALAVSAWNATGQSPKSSCVTATTTPAPSSSSGSGISPLELELSGVAVAVIVIALAVVLLMRRRKKAPEEPPSMPSESYDTET
jgi:hypothetical protein